MPHKQPAPLELPAKALFFLEKMLQNASSVKHQFTLQQNAANHLYSLQLKGEIKFEFITLPNEVKHEELHWLYSFLHAIDSK